MRPQHYVILEPGAMPMNRTAKVDVTRLQQMARDEVAKCTISQLRSRIQKQPLPHGRGSDPSRVHQQAVVRYVGNF